MSEDGQTTAQGQPRVESPAVPSLDLMCADDPVLRLLVKAMRSGQGSTLETAVRDLIEGQVAEDRVRVAEQKIRDYAADVARLPIPRSVTADGIESWYLGPSDNDVFWPPLREKLQKEGWTEANLRDLDDASTKVVAHLPEPHQGRFPSRGLVLGYVQSGKTTNFTAVIAKAADAGYRLFIVLSGVHNALRRQTQIRLEEQLRDLNSERWIPLTEAETGFRPPMNVDAFLSEHNTQKVLGVVLKNGTRLRSLKHWLLGANPEVLRSCPILIIDDEADQASVNTAKPDRNPTVINRLLREILDGLPKAAYVGYTATPFANVLIDPANYEDLYPRDFIVDLPRPKEYIGPEAIFGREPLEFDPSGEPPDDGHDLIREVPDEELPELRPAGPSKRFEFAPMVTESLEKALQYFLMSTAARRRRGKGNPHSTMLVHTSQYTSVHEQFVREIRVWLSGLNARRGAAGDRLLTALQEEWEEECARVSAEEFGNENVSFGEVLEALPEVIADVEVLADNSRSEVRLDYGGDPRTVIAVGGNTLSRGLTLEGLSVSFFVRSASAYDTLLQMGRWFGYRAGYADLTRIWMTEDMEGWFHHLATVEQEIRYDIERYEVEHLTPLDFGPRIRTHPKLAITSAAKMQQAVDANVSYSGRRLQTILFKHRDRDWLEQNLVATEQLMSQATEDRDVAWLRPGIGVLRGVPSKLIDAFLARYEFHENSRDLDRALIREYIATQQDELPTFNVAVFGRDPKTAPLGCLDLGLGREVGLINRARIDRIGIDYADIKALMSKIDRVMDLGVTEDELKQMEDGQVARLRNWTGRGGRGDGSGLLAIYPISKASRPGPNAKTRRDLDAVADVVGVGLVFPESATTEARGLAYKTADLSHVVREEPTDEDVPEDAEETDRPSA